MVESVQISLFGGVRAVSDVGVSHDVGPAKCQLVLAALALSVGTPVPVARLVELVWHTDPPRTADKTLQSYIARLRKGLGADAIARTGSAYVLNLPRAAVDVLRFQQFLDDGDAERALGEWTGELLAGLDADGFSATVDGLIERWLGAVELDLERRVDGDPAATVGRLTELTARHPYREGLWALLLLALYRSGRQADALAAYRTARTNLVEELGVEPGPRLQELESMILGQDDQLEVGRHRPAPMNGLPTGTVTFGFADVSGAAALWAGDRSAMAASMSRCEELVRAAAANQTGHLFTVGGDSFGVAFGRTSEAAAWADEIHAVIDDADWSGGAALSLSVGVHTGEADERDADYFGPSVNLAARLASLANGGQTLLSASTAALLGGRTDISDLGTAPIDHASPQRVHQLGVGDFPALRSVDSRRGNLPRRLGRLIGRHDELRAVAEALESTPITTLVGPGGIGKTRLAIEAATAAALDLADEVWLVELAGIAASDGVVRAVAEALRVKETPARGLRESIVAALDDRSVLLVLDNCEHVVDGAADLANAIARDCPNTRLLATSREGLGLITEQLIVVPPLDPGQSAVELFNARAEAADRSFDPDENRPAVKEICARLDGVPLAIELAAARSQTLSPTDMVGRLDDRLRLLTGGRRSSVERHRTMRATILWSYELLSLAEQRLFQRLSVFAGPFDLAAAEVIAESGDGDVAGEIDVDEVLGGLVARSILIAESGPFGRRFRLLETIRQFGAEHLSASGETDRVAARHAQWCLDRATAIGELLAGNEEVLGSRHLPELWPNLRMAFGWAITTGNAALAQDLMQPIALEVSLRNNSEVGDWAERLLAITAPDDHDRIAFGLFWAAHRYMMSQNQAAYDKLAAQYGESDHPLLSYARACIEDDDHALMASAPAAGAYLEAEGHSLAARLVEMEGVVGPMLPLGNFEGFDAACSQLLERCRTEGPPTFLHFTLFIAGLGATFQDQTDQAELYFDEATRIPIPDRTISLSKTLEARRAIRNSDAPLAFRLLAEHIDELLETENMIMARLVGVEFARMIVDFDRSAAVARIIAYVERSGPCGELAWGTLTLDAREAVQEVAGVDNAAEQAIGSELDDREALLFMRGVLAELRADAVTA